ncbi:MAG: HEAT repeat domain-containing protein [Candidatus Helarchaeota archaeon]
MEAILPLLNDPNWRIRASVVSVIGTSGNKGAVDSLIIALEEDDDMIVRKHTVVALSNLGDPIALNALEKTYNDPKNRSIKDKIKLALKKLSKIARSQSV